MNADTREKELTDVSLWPLGDISIAFRVLLCKRIKKSIPGAGDVIRNGWIICLSCYSETLSL